jgi:hypothetical protein
MLVPDVCATLRLSTADVPEPARAQAVRDLHLRERALLSDKLAPIEPLEPLPNCPLDVDLTKRTLPGLAVVSGTLSGLRHAIRPIGAIPNGGAASPLDYGPAVDRRCATRKFRDAPLVTKT